MKIVLISDCHLFGDKHKLGHQGINPFISLQSIFTAVKAENADRLVITGDLSGDGSLKSYQHFSELFCEAGIACPINILPGNHDDEGLLKQHFSADCLWLVSPLKVAASPWHVHLVNTKTEDSTGRVSASSLAKLEEHLLNHQQIHHLIAVHHHPIACDGWMDAHEWTNRADFVSLVEKYPSIKGVVYGHIHMDITQRLSDCLFMACPSTCWQWANTKSFSASDLAPGYRVLNLAKNGQIGTTVVRLS